MSLDQPSDFVKHQTTTRDAFLAGRITLSQPRNGFRAGFDSVLLGAAVRNGTQNLLDLGAGVGTAGLVALALGRAERATLVERHAETAALARENIADNGFSGRAEALTLDILASGPTRQAAGLAANQFDAVIANPPFFDAGQGTLAPEASRADAWIRCAAGCATAGGEFVIVYPAQGLSALLAAMAPRFGAVTVLPISPRPGAPATRVLVRGKKGSRAPLTLLAGRALHGEDGRDFAQEFDAIFRGAAALDW
jgi:tRNA1(Val) A37 N6-methylase TrmN6